MTSEILMNAKKEIVKRKKNNLVNLQFRVHYFVPFFGVSVPLCSVEAW